MSDNITRMIQERKNKNFIPWVEKYRPNDFDDIVLEDSNKIILDNIINFGSFPNLLFYGPPGTGKTTTIINIINKYQKKYTKTDTGLMIHLNASDERGIDIIRNQINQFVNSKALFNEGMKFVILDEVDYMTKTAQQALRYLLETCPTNVRFCLICNYISRIDNSLQNEFIRLRFNQLPENKIISFLKNIVDNEKININDELLCSIQKLFNSDLRSMINYIQSNHNSIGYNAGVIDNAKWEELYAVFKKNTTVVAAIKYCDDMSNTYYMDKKNIIKNYLNYIIRHKPTLITSGMLDFCENLLHNQNPNEYFIEYACTKLISFHNQ